jgi:retron-type reverse transcriptase
MFERICTIENLFTSHTLAQLDNRYKRKICAFTYKLEENLFQLRFEMTRGLYHPRPYTYFTLHDPKTRAIAAPDIRDRVVQHALVSVIQPLFEKQFIYDTYACREGKGTHFAASRLKRFLMAVRCRYGKDRSIYVLQCDIHKFFQSISWDNLLAIIEKTVACPRTMDLITSIVTTHQSAQTLQRQNDVQLSLFAQGSSSFQTSISVKNRTGLPIGNLTSQLFANIYLNELDHFMKDRLQIRYYARYMDDFLIIHPNKAYLKNLQQQINDFLQKTLHLALHPKKLTIKNVSTGVPFVGYRIFYDHILVRGTTLRRIERNYRSKIKQCKRKTLTEQKLAETKASMIGHFKHANTYGLMRRVFGK